MPPCLPKLVKCCTPEPAYARERGSCDNRFHITDVRFHLYSWKVCWLTGGKLSLRMAATCILPPAYLSQYVKRELGRIHSMWPTNRINSRPDIIIVTPWVADGCTDSYRSPINLCKNKVCYRLLKRPSLVFVVSQMWLYIYCVAFLLFFFLCICEYSPYREVCPIGVEVLGPSKLCRMCIFLWRFYLYPSMKLLLPVRLSEGAVWRHA